TGNFLHAIRISGKVLAVRGTILPSTLDVVRLGAELTDGRRVVGESSIVRQGVPIQRVFLEPGDVRALPEVFEAIAGAHVVVLAPGSLYTSLIPNLLVGGAPPKALCREPHARAGGDRRHVARRQRGRSPCPRCARRHRRHGGARPGV